jgi:hypothetical protein
VTLTANQSGGDGGGLWQGGGLVTSRDSVIGDNQDTGGEAPDCAGTLTTQGYTLLESAAGCTLAGDPTGNQVGVDPVLGPLRDNHGPTLTHALLAGNPAIDAGDPAGCVDSQGAPFTRDQRGVPRPIGPACDLGAYEFGDYPYTALLPVVRR